MSQTVVVVQVSLDGFIADAQGGSDWLAPFDTPEVNQETGRSAMMAGADMVVLGRGAFSALMARQAGCPAAAWPFIGKRVMVLTHHPLPQTSPPGVKACDDLGIVLRQARERSLSCWILGGGQVIGQALSSGYVDEVELFTAPVLLGAGHPWFVSHAGQGTPSLELLSCEGFRCGVTRTVYAVA